MKKKILLILVNCLTVFAIVVAVTAMVTVATTPKGEPPSIMGYSLFQVVSGSMEPAIKSGSLAVVKRVSTDSIAVGDVISFYSREEQIYGKINTHRVVEIEGDGQALVFKTRGDANLSEDRMGTAAADVIGRVVLTSNIIGAIVGIIQNKYMFFFIILAPLAFIFVMSIVKVVKTAKDEIKKVEQEEREKLSGKTGEDDEQ